MKAGPDRRRRGCPLERCRARRARWLDHPYDCAADGPICHRFDCELVDVYSREGQRSLVVIEAMSQRLQLHYARAQGLVSQQAQGPHDPVHDAGAFLAFIRTLHATVFRELPGCGAWRCDGEHATFDRGPHQRSGVAPGGIVAALLDLHARLVADRLSTDRHDASAEGLARRCAIFLVEFFAVHPFSDGNGRIGRLLVSYLVEVGGRYALQPWPDGRKAKRRYLWALRYAHRRRAQGSDPQGGPDPYRGVARVIHRLIIERAPDPPMEPPPWLADGPG